MNTDYPGLLFTVDQRGVATVSLNRPEVHNAFNAGLIEQLSGLFRHIDQNPQIRLMILTATGKHFSAGADLNWMQSMANYSYADNLADAQSLATMLAILNGLSKPTIARVQGAAYGGAVGLIACCDMAIATKLSQFCLSEVKLGLIPATISPYVINAMGARACRRYFSTAEVFSAQRARRLGLLSEAVTEEELDDCVETLVSQLLKNSPQAISAAKQLIFNVHNKAIDQTLIDYTCTEIARIRVSEEGQEGLQAFLAKRPANWNKSKP